MIEPGLLHFVEHAVGREPLDGRDLFSLRPAHWERAGAGGNAVDMDGTGAALRDATAVFGSRQTDLLPDHPQQRGIGINVDLSCSSVDNETSHCFLLLEDQYSLLAQADAGSHATITISPRRRSGIRKSLSHRAQT